MKGSEEIIIKKIVIISVNSESKNPIDISFVENPPVAIMVIPCAMLSNMSIPDKNSKKEQLNVNIQYIKDQISCLKITFLYGRGEKNEFPP